MTFSLRVWYPAWSHGERLAELLGLLGGYPGLFQEVTAAANGRYVETSRPQTSTLYVSPDAATLAPVWKALEAKPVAATTCRPAPFGLLLTDAAGYVAWAKAQKLALPYVSWISAPLYLVDDGDTLDKIDRPRLSSQAETITEIIKNFMVEK